MTRRNVLKAVMAFVAGCTVGVFGKTKHRLRVVANRCVGCRDCYRICPQDEAVLMRRGKAFINQEACNACMLCESVCTYGAIERCEKYEN